jgi:hypothetical protein
MSSPSSIMSPARLRLLICILLAGSSWRGPLPLLHRHDCAGGVSFHHAAACHAGAALHEIDGLHWHFAFPEAVTGKPCDGSAPEPQAAALLACTEMLQDSARGPVLMLQVIGTAEPVSWESVSDAGDTGRSQSLVDSATTPSAWLSSAPLVALTGVCTI